MEKVKASIALAARRKREAKGPRFDIEAVRRHAICCLALINTLGQKERKRVLEHALKVNRA
jgi:hypothetical protein